MKETKVYIDELPAQCLDCRFAYDGRCQAKENGESYCVENCRRSDCPLQSIKDHDRELVVKVLEEIKLRATYSKFGYMGKTEKGYYTIYAGILDQIQKEFEDE